MGKTIANRLYKPRFWEALIVESLLDPFISHVGGDRLFLMHRIIAGYRWGRRPFHAVIPAKLAEQQANQNHAPPNIVSPGRDFTQN